MGIWVGDGGGNLDLCVFQARKNKKKFGESMVSLSLSPLFPKIQ